MGLLAGYWALLSDAYNSKGARGMGFAQETFNQLQAWLENPDGPSWLSTSFIGAGAGFALLLGSIRMRLMGWPSIPRATRWGWSSGWTTSGCQSSWRGSSRR